MSESLILFKMLTEAVLQMNIPTPSPGLKSFRIEDILGKEQLRELEAKNLNAPEVKNLEKSPIEITKEIWHQHIQDKLSKTSGTTPKIQFPHNCFQFFGMARTMASGQIQPRDKQNHTVTWGNLTVDERKDHYLGFDEFKKKLKKLEKEGKIERDATWRENKNAIKMRNAEKKAKKTSKRNGKQKMK